MKSLVFCTIAALVSAPAAFAFGGKRLSYSRQSLALQLGADQVNSAPEQELLITRGTLEDLRYGELSDSKCAAAIDVMLKGIAENVFNVSEFHVVRSRVLPPVITRSEDLASITVAELVRFDGEAPLRQRLAALNQKFYVFVHSCRRSEPEGVLKHLGALVNFERAVVASRMANASFLKSSGAIVREASELAVKPPKPLRGGGTLESSQVPVAQALGVLSDLLKASRNEAVRLGVLADSRKLCAGAAKATLTGVELLRDPRLSISGYLIELLPVLKDDRLEVDLRRLRYLGADSRREVLVHYLDEQRLTYVGRAPSELAVFSACAFDAAATATVPALQAELGEALEAVKCAEDNFRRAERLFDPRQGD